MAWNLNFPMLFVLCILKSSCAPVTSKYFFLVVCNVFVLDFIYAFCILTFKDMDDLESDLFGSFIGKKTNKKPKGLYCFCSGAYSVL